MSMFRSVGLGVLLAAMAPLAGACKTVRSASALRSDGAATPAPPGVDQKLGQLAIASCKGCHHSTQFYPKWMAKWSVDTKTTALCLKDATAVEAKLACLEATDANGTSAIGLWRAYVTSAEVASWVASAKAALPPAAGAALDQRLDDLRQGYADGGAYMKPKTPLTDGQVKELVDWAGTDGALHYLQTASETVSAGGPVGVCKTETSPDLRKLLVDESGQLRGGWARKNLVEAGMTMYDCKAGGGDPSVACLADRPKFLQGGVDLRSPAATAAGYKLLTLETLSTKNTAYWTRSSPNGRFVGNGVLDAPKPGTTTPEAYGIVDDLLRKRTIRIEAAYDPGFSPDGEWLTFHGFFPKDGAAGVAHVIFCPASLLTTDITVLDPAKEPRCITRQKNGEYLQIPEYHTMASSLEQPFEFVAQGAWEDDNGGNLPDKLADYDARVLTAQTAFGQNTLNIFAFSNDAQDVKLAKAIPNLTNQGDFMMSPSGRIALARFGAPDGKDQIGYKVHLLTPTFAGDHVGDIADQDGGTICRADAQGHVVFGSAKTQYSLDERFVVTHNYNPRYTPTGETDIRPKESSSDIYLYDLLKNQAVQLTATPPGVFALYPHFRSDGWLYFLVRVRDGSQCGGKDCPDSVVAMDAAIQLGKHGL